MKIEVLHKDGNFHFEALNESGNVVHMDASPAIGGEGKGARPMELFIMGLGGCSGIDVLNILRKQKISPEGFRVEINANREADAVPSLFTDIHMKFYFNAPMDENKAKRAVDLSVEKYCSAAKTLEKTAKISYEIIIK